ncbi:MAG: S49 family peptidase [Vicinamibacterales bacterium]
MSTSRGVRILIGLLTVAFIVSAGAMLVLYLAVGGSPTVRAESTLVLQPQGDPPEVVPEVLLPGRDTHTLTVRGYVDLIRKAQHDPRVARLLIRPGSLGSPFWAKVQEIRDAIVDFRQSGKPVYAFLEYAGDKEYYLASAADRVVLLPSATLDLTGLASYEVFLRGTFDLIGTYPDFLHIGEYKTAVNTFTERTFTPAHREMSESLNRDQFDQLVRGIADARHLSDDEVRALIDRGPFLAQEALDAGLVDDLAYEDELDDLDGIDIEPVIEVPRLCRGHVGFPRRHANGAHCGRHVVGTITSGESGYDPLNGPVVGSGRSWTTSGPRERQCARSSSASTAPEDRRLPRT